MIDWNGIKIVETDCMLPIDRVKPYARNAKRHPQEQIDEIKASIKRFGMDDPNIDIPEIHLPDTIELDDDIDFSVADLVDEEGKTQKIQFAVQTQPRNGRNHERKAQHEGLSNQGGDKAWSFRAFTRICQSGFLSNQSVQVHMTSRLSRQQANQT